MLVYFSYHRVVVSSCTIQEQKALVILLIFCNLHFLDISRQLLPHTSLHYVDKRCLGVLHISYSHLSTSVIQDRKLIISSGYDMSFIVKRSPILLNASIIINNELPAQKTIFCLHRSQQLRILSIQKMVTIREVVKYIDGLITVSAG